MTADLITRARALADRATQPGPWSVMTTDGHSTVVDAHGMWVADCGPAPEAAFIAAARELVPALCDALERSERERTLNPGPTLHGSTIIEIAAERDALRAEVESLRAQLDAERNDRQYWSNAHARSAARVSQLEAELGECKRLLSEWPEAQRIERSTAEAIAAWLDHHVHLGNYTLLAEHIVKQLAADIRSGTWRGGAK